MIVITETRFRLSSQKEVVFTTLYVDVKEQAADRAGPPLATLERAAGRKTNGPTQEIRFLAESGPAGQALARCLENGLVVCFVHAVSPLANLAFGHLAFSISCGRAIRDRARSSIAKC